MPDKPFVVNDRRKFTADGELRPDVVISETADEAESGSATHAAVEEPASGPHLVGPADADDAHDAAAGSQSDEPAANEPPPLTEEQMEGAARAYGATAERLDTAMRAADPGGERMPPMSFGTLVQSLYMQAILQLGGATEPGQQPRIDLLGARQTIDMLAVVADKTQGNLQPEEAKLLDAALFEMRMGFLDVTQALARQAANREGGAPPAPGAGPTGPQRIR